MASIETCLLIRTSSPHRTVTKYIRIGIGDKNDNAPYFEQALYEAEVNEDEDIQHTVITVTAKDKDECEYPLFFSSSWCWRSPASGRLDNLGFWLKTWILKEFEMDENLESSGYTTWSSLG